MITLWGSKQRFCDGISRRTFLRIGGFGLGWTLADMLALQAKGIAATAAPRARSAIMIFLPGGPSHLDMYDLKPNAAVEFRGEFKPISTNVPGVQICEHLPLHARMMDKLAVVRSVVSVEEHADSLVTTGYPEIENRMAHHPCFGAVVSKLRGSADPEVPPFIDLRGMRREQGPGYLGVAHSAFKPNGPGGDDLQLVRGVDRGRVEEREPLLAGFDSLRREVDASGVLDGLDMFRQRAFHMVASGAVRNALDLTRENPVVRERYKGLEQFLTARRLIEAGAGYVTLVVGTWDTHRSNFKTMKRQLPDVDRGVTNLIQDLHDRGMQNDVVTILWGEFGRTPRINNQDGGRDHWAPAMSALVAGGGLKMGQAIGATSARGEYPTDRPYHVSQVLSTLYRTMGIDPALTFPNTNGRPMHILDDRDPVKELL